MRCRVAHGESLGLQESQPTLTVSIAKIDLAKNVIVADLGAILSSANVDHNAPNTSPGCMSFPKDGDCPAVMSSRWGSSTMVLPPPLARGFLA